MRFLKKASMTVEAALVMPFFFLCMTALATMPDLYTKYAKDTVALQQRAEKAAKAETAISGGENASEAVINLPDFVRYKPFALPFPSRKFTFICRGRTRAWVGYGEEDGGREEADDDEMVYVTDHESVYHTSSSCTHLDLSWKAVPGTRAARLRNDYGARYHACEKCVSNGRPAATVYLSPEGDAYHNSPTCGGLTRHVRIVRRSEIGELHECSRCRERDAEKNAEDDGS